ncbi:uncharacterized protein LOC120519032 [Polypterus senegalus]|uniref:uncharacterized protein LOC120519032 n=1 Tax=Polypterus senegalus TaxID=55291 RepID=UPI0019669DB0|nr:uncharacterized protein LOC120519032 [Polypterus senegalus]
MWRTMTGSSCQSKEDLLIAALAMCSSCTISMYHCTKPTLETLQRKIERQGWESNCPQAGEILSLWKPASNNEVEEDRKISRAVQHLRWRGLHIKDFGSEKGFGVVATRRFSKGDIFCDYLPVVITN